MKSIHLRIIFSFMVLSVLVLSCKKSLETDDKNKIDIKGSMTNGDMRSPNIEAYLELNTLWVQFHEDFGNCIVSVTSRDSSLVVCDTIETYSNASWRFYMGGEPLNRYHLVISNGTDDAEGWFFNFRTAAVRPKQ